MMKKILLLIFTLIILTVLYGCNDDKINLTDQNLQTTSATQNASDETDDSQKNTYDATNGADSTEAPHVHSYTTNVIAPTCTADGYTTYTCTCGNNYVSDKTTSVGHDFGEWHTTKEPTAAETGFAERVCVSCNFKNTKVLGKIIENHAHSFTSRVTKAATCNQVGETTFSCSCGETYTEEIVKSKHNYKTSVSKPTCVNEGYTTYTCSCGDSYVSNRVAPLGHTFSEWKIIGAATTLETETAERVCSKCKTRETKTLAHNHNYESAITLTALCNREGIKKYSCASCGHTYTEPIPKLSPDGSHTYGEGQTISTPTCAINGKMKYTCIHGDMYYYETIPATGKHNYSRVEIFSKATCTKNGYQKVRCANCADWYGETIPALGHSYDSGQVIIKATCCEDGETKFTCIRCENAYIEYTPSLSYCNSSDVGRVVRQATCTEEGLMAFDCIDCGVTCYTENIPKIPHNYSGGICINCGKNK